METQLPKQDRKVPPTPAQPKQEIIVTCSNILYPPVLCLPHIQQLHPEVASSLKESWAEVYPHSYDEAPVISWCDGEQFGKRESWTG